MDDGAVRGKSEQVRRTDVFKPVNSSFFLGRELISLNLRTGYCSFEYIQTIISFIRS
jgi:hypothetical protein